MSARISHWGAGLALSVVAHLGAGTALLAALQPEPVTEQPSPSSELEVEAYSLQRDTARQSQPDPEAAPEAEAGETALDPGAIPRSRAEAVAAPSTALTPEAAPSDALGAARLSAAALAPAARPSANALDAAQAPADRLAAAAPEGEAVDAVTGEAEAVAVAAPPIATALATSAPLAETVAVAAPATAAAVVSSPIAPQLAAAPATAARARPVSPSSEPVQTAALVAPKAAALTQSATRLPETPAPAEGLAEVTPAAAPLPPARAETTEAVASETPQVSAPPVTPQAERMTATLAFPGGDGGVDPVSLAAFQSFMQPGDVTASGDTLRDGVSALLAQVPCSRLQVAFDPETVTLQINGHIPEDDLRAPVLAALGAQMGADIALSDNILILPRPQCGALSGIADVGLPQSTDQITNPLLIGNDAHARVFGFVKDDALSFDITGPEYPSYIYVDFFDAGGNVIHIAPNERKPLQLHEADAPYRIGTRTPSEQGLHMLIAPPYGQEIVVAFAASEPLYDGLRPVVEPAAPYLEWLKARVADAREKHPDFKGEWVYFFVSTSEG